MMEEERKKLAKKYEKIKLIKGITSSIISFMLLFLFVALGYSKQLEVYAYGYSTNPYLALLIYIFILGLVSSVLSFPVDYYFGFRLEHKFGLSNLTFIKWITEGLKSAGVGIVLGVPMLLLFYYILRNFQPWWLWFACVTVVYSILLVQLAPVMIFPLFYKFKPIENNSLRQRILGLCDRVGFKVKGVFSFDMSKTSKKVNAAFTGLGRTKRIILSDTLIAGFTEDEIETVFAHELGHYKKGHIRKNIIISFFTTFAGLFILSEIYSFLLVKFGFTAVWDIGALPLLALIISVSGFLIMPAGMYLSRRFEYEADRFAIETTMNLPVFRSVMGKLAFQNLSNEEPNKLVEFWSYSHPSIKHRIKAAEKYYKTLTKA